MDFIKNSKESFSKKVRFSTVSLSIDRIYEKSEQRQAEIAEHFWNHSIYYKSSTNYVGEIGAVAGFKIVKLDNAPIKGLKIAGEKEKEILTRFLHSPTSEVDEVISTLLYKTLVKMTVHGRASWEVYRDKDDTYEKGFYVKVIDGWVKPNFGPTGVAEKKGAYSQLIDKNKIPVNFDIDQVILFRVPDPFKMWNSKSNIGVLDAHIAMEIHSQDWNLNYFKNSAIPAGLFKLPSYMSLDEFLAAREDIHNAYRGTENAHTTAIVVQGEIGYEQIQNNPEQAQLGQTRERIRDTIFGVEGVSAAVMGIPYSTGVIDKNLAEKRFYTRIAFLQHLIVQQLNLYLQKHLNFKFYGLAPKVADIARDKDEVDAVQRQYEMGLITVNEAREQLGKPPIMGPEGNRLLIPNTPIGPTTLNQVISADEDYPSSDADASQNDTGDVEMPSLPPPPPSSKKVPRKVSKNIAAKQNHILVSNDIESGDVES